MVRKGEISAQEWLIKNGAGQETTDNISVEKTKEIAEEKEAGTSEAEKKKNIIKKNQARLKRREALGKTKRGKNSDIVFKDGGFQINQREEKKEQSAIPTETSKEVKAEVKTQMLPEEPSAIEKPEEKTTGDLEQKKERIEELEKRERELLDIFEQNKNKPWGEKKDIIVAAINELEKSRAEKTEIEKETKHFVQEQPEDLESDYDIAKKRMPTNEEQEKLNPLITKATNAADVYIPEKFIEEEPGQQKTIEPLIANEETMQKEYEIAFEKTRIKNLESKLAAMEAEIEKKENGLRKEDASKWEKLKNFVKKHPKATTVIALGLVGGGFAAFGSAPLYYGAQALVKAWGGSLWLPYAHGASSLTPAVATGAFFGGEKLAKWIGEKIGAVKSEKDAKTAVKEVLENIKNAGSEQRPANISGDAELKIGEPQTTREKTEKEESNIISSEDAVKYFEENKVKSNDELNLEDIKKMMEAIRPETTKNLIKFLIDKEKRKNNDIYDWLWQKKKEIEKAQSEGKNDGVLIKKTEKMKNTAPETEDKFDKPAEDVKAFVGQFKEGKKTGEEIFNYLENLRYNLFYLDKINFNSKIKPEIDKLSKKEKTDMIDSTVEYLRSEEEKGKLNRSADLANDLHDIIYGKDFTELSYVVSGKPKNVEWLRGNKS